MMKLSLMKKVFETVDSNWNCGVADQIVSRWSHSRGSVKMLRASANFICIYEDGSANRILRFSGSQERSPSHVLTEMEIVDDLVALGVRTAVPIRSLNGNLVETIETLDGTFHCTAFQRLPGKTLEMGELSDDQFYLWGGTLGNLHESFRNCSMHTKHIRPSIADLFEWAQSQMAEESQIMRVCTKISKWLTALSKGGAEYGLIHYDFELDNLIWNNNGASIIDLDDCIQSWYVADIAYALRDLFPDGDFSPCRQYKAFLRGYSECFQFDTRWLWEIPKFYQVHAIVSLARLKRSLDISESTDNPQWMNELIGKLKAFCEKYRRMVTTAAVWD